MKSYKLAYRRSVAKDLRSIPTRSRKAIVSLIENLAKDPRPNGATKIKGYKQLYRVRCGDYRVIYQIDEGVVTVLIIKVGHRKAVYKSL